MKLQKKPSLYFKIIILLTIFFPAYHFSFDSGNSQMKIYQMVDDSGLPCKQLLQLLELEKIDHKGSLDSIVDATQKKWLRQPGKERWEMEEMRRENNDAYYDLFGKVGFLYDIDASRQYYDYALLLGCSLPAMRARLVFLKKQWDNGVRFDRIIIAGGPRPLDSVRESSEELCNIPHAKLPFKEGWELKEPLPLTEFEMLQFVWNQSDLPSEIVNLPISWIEVPMKESSSGKKIRPGTIDLLEAWLKNNPMIGSCLAISTQPFIGQQNSALRTVLEPQGFTVETIGYKTSVVSRIEVCLDNIARLLYQEKKRLKL